MNILYLPIRYETLLKKYYNKVSKNIEDYQQDKDVDNYNLYKIDDINTMITNKNDTDNEQLYTYTKGNTKILDKIINLSYGEETEYPPYTIDINTLKAKKTDIACWWCCHTFDNYPVSIPYKFYQENRLFKCKGIFCGFPCALSYAHTKKGIDISLLKMLYRQIMNIKPQVVEIKKAPPKEVLKMFGGAIDIEEFRGNGNNALYDIISYPVIYVNDQLHAQYVYGNNTTATKNNVQGGTLNNTVIRNAKQRLKKQESLVKKGETIAEKLQKQQL